MYSISSHVIYLQPFHSIQQYQLANTNKNMVFSKTYEFFTPFPFTCEEYTPLSCFQPFTFLVVSFVGLWFVTEVKGQHVTLTLLVASLIILWSKGVADMSML